MFSNAFVVLSVLSVYVLAVGAEPDKRNGDTTMGFNIPGIPEVTVSAPDDVDNVIATVVAHSKKVGAAMGTSSLLSLEADLVYIQATKVIGESQPTGSTTASVTAYVSSVSGVPVVHVSEIGGTGIVTLATGTEGSPTTLGGLTFTAAPQRNVQNNGASGRVVSGGRIARAGAILGAMAMGAAVLF